MACPPRRRGSGPGCHPCAGCYWQRRTRIPLTAHPFLPTVAPMPKTGARRLRTRAKEGRLEPSLPGGNVALRLPDAGPRPAPRIPADPRAGRWPARRVNRAGRRAGRRGPADPGREVRQGRLTPCGVERLSPERWKSSDPTWLTTSEVAAVLGVTQPRVSQLARRGFLPFERPPTRSAVAGVPTLGSWCADRRYR